jgi:hypothetical protein
LLVVGVVAEAHLVTEAAAAEEEDSVLVLD